MYGIEFLHLHFPVPPLPAGFIFSHPPLAHQPLNLYPSSPSLCLFVAIVKILRKGVSFCILCKRNSLTSPKTVLIVFGRGKGGPAGSGCSRCRLLQRTLFHGQLLFSSFFFLRCNVLFDFVDVTLTFTLSPSLLTTTASMRPGYVFHSFVYFNFYQLNDVHNLFSSFLHQYLPAASSLSLVSNRRTRFPTCWSLLWKYLKKKNRSHIFPRKQKTVGIINRLTYHQSRSIPRQTSITFNKTEWSILLNTSLS